MAFFKKLFKKEDGGKLPKGYNNLTIKQLSKEGTDTVVVTLDIPENLKSEYNFTEGQYLTFELEINAKKIRRSYSICSGKNEDLSVAVKQVEKGLGSTWFNQTAQIGDVLSVSKPEGNFIIPNDASNIVAIAAGSGITPILSMTKKASQFNSFRLLYGSRYANNVLFKEALDTNKNISSTYFLSGETVEGFENGRISKETLSELVKSDLSILKADAFMLCGPEQLIVDAKTILTTFGVAEDKIHFELFTTPVLMESTKTEESVLFNGKSKVTVILDSEETFFELDSSKNLLDKISDEGVDAPYSCRGGVCSSCKAKVIKGKATMKMNYSLTDKEVEEGYILTCQAVPASEELTISYDA